MSLKFALATPAQLAECVKYQWTEWGKTMPEDTYVWREGVVDFLHETVNYVLLESDAAADGSSSESEKIVGTCRFSKRKAVCGKQIFSGYVVANVLVLPERRGTGLGKKLKQHIDKWLRQSGTSFSTLFSGVGRFYEPEFETIGSSRAVFNPCAEDLPSQVKFIKDQSTDLGRERLQKFAEQDCLHLIASSEKNDFVILPDFVRYDFFYALEAAGAREKNKATLTERGCWLHSKASSDEEPSYKEAFIVWHADYGEDRLVVLRLKDHGDYAQKNKLMAAAQYVAFQAKLGSVLLVDDNLDGLDLTKAEILSSAISIPCGRFYNAQLKEASWSQRQRYSWS